MYKRGIDNIEVLKNKEIYTSNYKNAYMSLGGNLNVYKPYHGLYMFKNKVFVEEVVERVELGNDIYRLGDFSTLSQKVTTEDTLSIADDENLFYEYSLDDKFTLSKKIRFIEDTNIMCIEYLVHNLSNKKAIIKVIPMVTYKDVLTMKKSDMLKFNISNNEEGVLLNLNISQNDNLILKSDLARFNKIGTYLNNMLHEATLENFNKESAMQDLFIPGEFEMKVKPGSDIVFRLYISNTEFKLDKELFNKLSKIRECNIKEEYVELKKLVKAIEHFDTEYLTASIPSYINIDKVIKDKDIKNSNLLIDELLKITKAVEGQFLALGNTEKALSRINKIKNIIEYIEDNNVIDTKIYEFKLLKLWLVEQIYKIYERTDSNRAVEGSFEFFIQNVVQELHTNLKKETEDFNKLEYICLAFNTLKIQEKMYGVSTYISMYGLLKDRVINEFYSPNKRLLKHDLSEEDIYSTPEMIYSLSLSYQVIDPNIGIIILDTIFKELYTPYGLRKYSKLSSKNNGLIYPRYMAHFVKANLRQNGVTYASQKIAYNLVKELLIDISKHTLNSIKYVYHEKGMNIDKNGLDLLTTAEIIRLYNMFT